jgi:predicted component of type VI protein secretion system
MARCPAGHESEASDYCDTCGLVIGGEASGGASASAASAAPTATLVAPGAGSSGGSGARCPVCQAERNGRFCEECGYDFDLAEAMPQVTLSPGVGPAEPDPLARTLAQPEPEAAAEPVGGSAAENGAGAGQGLDLEAELARAEAEAAQAASAAVPTPVEAEPAPEPEPEPAPVFPDPLAESAAEPEHAVPLALTGTGQPYGLELSLVIDVDRDYYKAQVERGDIIEADFPFPKYPHERRFTFADGPVRIGRASASRGLAPEIDLTGPPLDPAVSHLHAQLLRHDEGWVVVDLGSANGTRLNDAEEPLEAETEIPVKQGDRIHLGVFTTITVQ